MSFVRKSLAVGLGQIASLLFGVTAGMIFSRVLKPDGMGQYELFRNTSILISAVGTLGIGQANIYFLNHRGASYPQIVTDSLKVGMLTGVLLGAGLTAIVMILPHYFGTLGWVPAIAYGAATALIIVRNLLRPVLVAKLASRGMAIVDASQSAVLLAMGIPVAVAGRLTTSVGITLFTLGIAASVIILLWYVRADIQFGRAFARPLFAQVLWYGIKIGAANVLLILSSSLTILILRRLSTGEFSAIGLYTRASALTNLAMMMPIAIGPMLYSKWAASARQNIGPQVEFAMRVHLAYGLCVAIGLLLFGKYILLILYGRAFVPANGALVILGFATGILCVIEPLVQLLAGTGRAGRFLMVLIVAFVVLMISLAILVPRFGIEGAAVGVLISNLSALGYAVALAGRYAGVRPSQCIILTPRDMRHLFHAMHTPRIESPLAQFQD